MISIPSQSMKSRLILTTSLSAILWIAAASESIATPNAALANDTGRDVPEESIPAIPEEGTNVGSPLFRSCQTTDGDYWVCSDEAGKIIAFNFSNIGPNRIVPILGNPGEGPERHYDFTFRGRKRQEIHFRVTDAPTGSISNLRESYIYVFPRLHLPAVRRLKMGSDHRALLEVLLPTGESTIFDSNTHEIVAGVIQERPMDLKRYAKDPQLFAPVNYTGPHVSIRVNRRGEDPRLGTRATITSGDPKCAVSASDLSLQVPCPVCVVPSSQLWTQGDELDGRIHFRYPLDHAIEGIPETESLAFDTFLRRRCGFGIR
jgi:hypothetical protein